jgi:hypothetical protein
VKLPRVRIWLLMLAVAVVAVTLAVIPVFNRLLWLYRAPLSINLVGGKIEPRWLGLEKPARVGRPVPVQCSYNTSINASIPSGLIYTLTAEVKLVDSAGSVLEAHRQTHRLIARGKAGKEEWEELNCTLTPRRPGDYAVRYEVNATDQFGRTGNVAIHTGGFIAR